MRKLLTAIVAIALIIFSQVCAQAQLTIDQYGQTHVKTIDSEGYRITDIQGNIVGHLWQSPEEINIFASDDHDLSLGTGVNNTYIERIIIENDGDVGIGESYPDTLLHVGGETTIDGYFHLHSWNVVGSTDVCRNQATLSYCSSSRRYKENIKPLNMGLETVEKLEPVTFDWKQPGKNDLGLIAEEVEKIDPILVTYNDDGQVEGVKYKQLTAVLVNAIKELKTENEKLRASMLQQQSQLDGQKTRFDELLSKLEIITEGQLVAYNNRYRR